MSVRSRIWAVLLATSFGCGPREPVVLAAAGWWSTPDGAMSRRGVELAGRVVDEAGGIDGRPLRIRYFDDGGLPDSAVAVATRIVRDGQIVAVVGHSNAPSTRSSASIYEGHLASVAPTTTSPELTGISPWAFRLNLTDSAYAAVLASLSRRRGWRTAAVLHENLSSRARSMAWAFEDQFPGTIEVADPIGVDSGGAAVEPVLSLLRRRAPDVVFLGTRASVAAGIIHDARAAGIEATFVSSDPLLGLVGRQDIAGEVILAVPFVAVPDDSSAARFVSRFQAAYGVVPDAQAALSYDAVMAVVAAMRRGGTGRAAIRGALAGLADAGGVPGVTGRVSFARDGDRRGGEARLVQLVDGRADPIRARRP